jgi:hypothetical protein
LVIPDRFYRMGFKLIVFGIDARSNCGFEGHRFKIGGESGILRKRTKYRIIERNLHVRSLWLSTISQYTGAGSAAIDGEQRRRKGGGKDG